MTHLDTLLFLWINATPDTSAWLLALARWASTGLPTLAILALAPLVLFGPAARHQVLGVFLSMVLAWLAVRGIRETVHVARPFELGLGWQGLAHAATAGFPSFHAAVAGAWAMGLALLAPRRGRRWLLVAGGVALVVAWSRVFLGLHFVSDVLVGGLLGGASAMTVRQGMAWAAVSWRRFDTNRHKTRGTAAASEGVLQGETLNP
ncbi:phosphatase PAP2 family protein [Hydrogenophaga sp. BPS33]|uniref:phosphatase PAP2 family protein n=1 Tax=Hydrogenophaga sp. BPS33 TaxID=2651974 RepID=UPI001320244F|nr:phosphatase PAP2 family protein [Hydrogenophaga sp. BPS33]QHE83980.1 phosphatase PAP2 family protein [Hydrogenophaga sp. BPS33]